MTASITSIGFQAFRIWRYPLRCLAQKKTDFPAALSPPGHHAVHLGWCHTCQGLSRKQHNVFLCNELLCALGDVHVVRGYAHRLAVTQELDDVRDPAANAADGGGSVLNPDLCTEWVSRPHGELRSVHVLQLLSALRANFLLKLRG